MAGAVGCWGDDGHGQTAVPTAASSSQVAVALGDSHTCSLSMAGAVGCWGNNGHGQTAVPVAATSYQVAVAAAYDGHTCSLSAAGTVSCWGLNDYGQTNVPVVATSHQLAIALGASHTCSLSSSVGLLCWGRNDFGETTVPAEFTSVGVALPCRPASFTFLTPSSTLTGTAATSPTPSPSLTVTPGLTCPPSHFRAIPRTDLVGAPLTDAPLATASEGACRIACCGAPGCDGYAFAFTELRFSSSASCSLYANLSATAPNSFAASGLRVGVVLPNPSASTSPAGTPLPEGGWPQRGGSVTPTITESYSPTASTTPSPTLTWVPGFISTIGGNGDSGYGGDGGPATAASLCPSSVAVISTGSIIISDACNNRIRLVVSGIISTIAGNGAGGFGGDGSQATFARLNMPTSVTVTLLDRCHNLCRY